MSDKLKHKDSERFSNERISRDTSNRFVLSFVALTAVTAVLVRVVAAVIVAIARPHSRDASAISAGELIPITSDVLWYTHSIFVHQSAVIIAFAFRRTIVARMAGLIAAAIVDLARINGTLLSSCGEDVKVSRRVLQSLHQFDFVGSGVLFCSVNSTKLEIRPIDMTPEDSDSERIDGSANQNFPVLPFEIRPLDFLAHSIGPVQHPVVVIDR